MPTAQTRARGLAVAALVVTAGVHAQGNLTPAEVLKTGQFAKAYADAASSAAGGQLQATWNSFFGREDLDVGLKGVPRASTACRAEAARASDARAWLLRNARDRKVLMLNDDHMHVAPRAFVLKLLPALRKLGYSHIGFEALAPEATSTGGDLAATGYYTVEPLFAALLRNAGRLGFKVFGYESVVPSSALSADEKFRAREQGQARNIAAEVAHAPASDRFVIFAGFGHIRANVVTGGNDSRRYMASYLKEYAGIEPLTIDLTSCAYAAPEPGEMRGKVFLQRADDAPLTWGIFAGAVSGQIWLPVPDPARAEPGFYRQLLGRQVRIPAALRRGPGLVLVEGRSLDPAAVAYDRVLLRPGENLPLYLPTGHSYELVAYGEDGTLVGRARIRVAGRQAVVPGGS
jgi:hypothetical protein